MVWIAEQSPLYKSVEKFNSEKAPEREQVAEEKKQDIPQREAFRNEESGNRRSAEQELRREQPRHSPQPCERPNSASSGNLLQRITGDRDFMLIAALILLLLHEKADMKLIAALAFIILT